MHDVVALVINGDPPKTVASPGKPGTQNIAMELSMFDGEADFKLTLYLDQPNMAPDREELVRRVALALPFAVVIRDVIVKRDQKSGSLKVSLPTICSFIFDAQELYPELEELLAEYVLSKQEGTHALAQDGDAGDAAVDETGTAVDALPDSAAVEA